jgi:hypothetical protein
MGKRKYILKHEHRFGIDIHFFASNENYTGLYDNKEEAGEINELANKLNIDIEFDRGETIEIADVTEQIENITDID